MIQTEIGVRYGGVRERVIREWKGRGGNDERIEIKIDLQQRCNDG